MYVLQLVKSEFSRKTYFCKLDLSNGYFHLSMRPEDRTHFGFSFDNHYYVFNLLYFGYKPAPDYFQASSQDLVRIQLGFVIGAFFVELNWTIFNLCEQFRILFEFSQSSS